MKGVNNMLKSLVNLFVKKEQSTEVKLVNILNQFQNDSIERIEDVNATAEAIFNLDDVEAVHRYILNYHNNRTYCGASEYFETVKKSYDYVKAYTNWLKRLARETKTDCIIHEF
jgi:hypothetical protein